MRDIRFFGRKGAAREIFHDDYLERQLTEYRSSSASKAIFRNRQRMDAVNSYTSAQRNDLTPSVDAGHQEHYKIINCINI